MPDQQTDLPLPLETVTPWGRIAAVGFVGERYYWIVDKHGGVAMITADAVGQRVAR